MTDERLLFPLRRLNLANTHANARNYRRADAAYGRALAAAAAAAAAARRGGGGGGGRGGGAGSEEDHVAAEVWLRLVRPFELRVGPGM